MEFYKYSGSGNDFIMLDDRNGEVKFSAQNIAQWCDRRFGIGADGVILVGASAQHDFSMRIINSDGTEAEMCGNGARCSVHFAYNVLGLNKSKKFSFNTMNGVYAGELLEDDLVKIEMTELFDVESVDVSDFSSKNAMYLNTGVPHTVIQVNTIDDVSVKSVGSAIRHDSRFKGGSNVCFFDVVKGEEQTVRLRVYERGVEDETLCCGTGVMATAVACSKFFGWKGEVKVYAKGGELSAVVGDDLSKLFFCGKVKNIFSGKLF